MLTLSPRNVVERVIFLRAACHFLITIRFVMIN